MANFVPSERESWEDLRGLLATPAAPRPLEDVTLTGQQLLTLMDALDFARFRLRTALDEFIAPVLAQSPDGADAEQLLEEARAVLEHLFVTAPGEPERRTG